MENHTRNERIEKLIKNIKENIDLMKHGKMINDYYGTIDLNTENNKINNDAKIPMNKSSNC